VKDNSAKEIYLMMVLDLSLRSLLGVALIAGSWFIHECNGHGMMTSPRSRNEFAAQQGVEGVRAPGLPPKEYCSHCLNTNRGVCGISSNGANYDNYLDSTGVSMPWISQGNYVEGQEISIKSFMSTHHMGHIEVFACADGPSSTMGCFTSPGHRLLFVRDNLHGMPADPSYPERGKCLMF